MVDSRVANRNSHSYNILVATYQAVLNRAHFTDYRFDEPPVEEYVTTTNRIHIAGYDPLAEPPIINKVND